ncbi:unnamed protein product [Pieris macdunnoughi]|uniref:FLYWCH-type domain-containing protein n=1 Tax=Pieris macdunnoughi TaxID=345717 RepID=A0A821Q8X8_9NEOP|nr:unnamed protein product [Pieris macdunnoughi]
MRRGDDYLKKLIVVVTFAVNQNQKNIAIVDGYCFYPDERHSNSIPWHCTRSKTCKARFTTSKDKTTVRKSNFTHTHPPPRFLINNGVYYRLS